MTALRTRREAAGILLVLCAFLAAGGARRAWAEPTFLSSSTPRVHHLRFLLLAVRAVGPPRPPRPRRCRAREESVASTFGRVPRHGGWGGARSGAPAARSCWLPSSACLSRRRPPARVGSTSRPSHLRLSPPWTRPPLPDHLPHEHRSPGGLATWAVDGNGTLAVEPARGGAAGSLRALVAYQAPTARRRGGRFLSPARHGPAAAPTPR